jgi:hypothetical protein
MFMFHFPNHRFGRVSTMAPANSGSTVTGMHVPSPALEAGVGSGSAALTVAVGRAIASAGVSVGDGGVAADTVVGAGVSMESRVSVGVMAGVEV